jgi:phosphatidylglycerophosphate synthase
MKRGKPYGRIADNDMNQLHCCVSNDPSMLSNPSAPCHMEVWPGRRCSLVERVRVGETRRPAWCRVQCTLHLAMLPLWRKSGPRLHERVIAAHLFWAILLWGLALRARAVLGLEAGYPLKALALFAIATVLCLKFLGRYHPFAKYGPGNCVTLVRSMLVALVASLIGEATVPTVATMAVAVSVVIAALDGVDGWLARRSGLTSTFGARFDVETDSALILALSILSWQHGKAASWVVLCGLLRYTFVAAGLVLTWMAGPLRPTLRAKAIAVLQMGALSFALVPVISVPLSTTVAAIALAALLWSFAVDVGRLWRSRA